jgi:hypothetical protein
MECTNTSCDQHRLHVVCFNRLEDRFVSQLTWGRHQTLRESEVRKAAWTSKYKLMYASRFETTCPNERAPQRRLEETAGCAVHLRAQPRPRRRRRRRATLSAATITTSLAATLTTLTHERRRVPRAPLAPRRSMKHCDCRCDKGKFKPVTEGGQRGSFQELANDAEADDAPAQPAMPAAPIAPKPARKLNKAALVEEERRAALAASERERAKSLQAADKANAKRRCKAAASAVAAAAAACSTASTSTPVAPPAAMPAAKLAASPAFNAREAARQVRSVSSTKAANFEQHNPATAPKKRECGECDLTFKFRPLLFDHLITTKCGVGGVSAGKHMEVGCARPRALERAPPDTRPNHDEHALSGNVQRRVPACVRTCVRVRVRVHVCARVRGSAGPPL